MLRPKLFAGIFITCFLLCASAVHAQAPTWTLDPFGKQKKPEKYEDKLLPSEKTQDKKFGPVRKVLQNTTSHYNFYFNANQRLNNVIERARIANKDDYAKLLSFYPYSLENTAGQATDLDSVIYKATAGILLHDLRSSWVDNFYLLIGKAYYFKQDFDSAALTFQFINYNLYPRKKNDDDYMRVVGSNEVSAGNKGNTAGSVSIADKEDRNFLQKAFTLPPSRNDALIWQIRTFTEQKEYGDAAGLISILQNDKNLPKRLKNDLDEVTAYWFYAQNNYDSSAAHLAKALSNADSKEDKSRWEYLLAQMYEMTGQYDAASEYYVKAAKHTADPVMDIYGRLNEAKMMRNSGNFKELDNSIANLLKMAKKDRYEAFRDVIYYSAAQLTLQRPDTTSGIGYYNKSINYYTGNSTYRDRSYLQLANIAYTQHRYRDAASYYDSLTISGDIADSATIAERKEILKRLVPMLVAVEREDSLQRLADMPAAEREAFIRKMVRKYQKENGLKEDDFAGNTLITFNERNNKPVDLFAAAGANTGDWYFYNASLKSKGFNDFKSKWGKRSNVDNWRRKTASEAAINKNVSGNPDIDPTIPQDGKGLVISQPDKLQAFTYDGLMGKLPLSKEMRDSSNGTIAENLYNAGLVFQNELEDYPQAIATFDDLIRRFPNSEKLSDVYYNLSYSWLKMGDKAKSDYYKNLVQTNFAGSNAARMIANPGGQKADEKNPAVTARYEEIYRKFIEGNFEEALTAKRKADSSYGKNYWSPQLLYIESVFYIKARRDSEAISVLKNIQQLYPASALKEKATTMIDVLSRRDSIEKYLTALQVTRAEEEKIIFADDNNNNVKTAAQVTKPTEIKAPVITAPKVMPDSVKIPDAFVNKSFVLRPEAPHYVAMILNKVDAVYVNEAKNAFGRFNKESIATANVAITKDALDANNSLLLFTPFSNAQEALKYFERIKKAAPSEVSWLQPSKYSFIIISENNLQLLKTNKDIGSYKQLLNTNFGNKF